MSISDIKIKSPLLELITLIYLSIEVFFRPIIKYFEWHQEGFRINISIIYASLLGIALIEIFLKIHSKKLIIPKDISQSLAVFLMVFIGLYQVFHFPYITSHPIYRIQDFFLFYFAESFVRGALYLISGFYLIRIFNRNNLYYIFLIFWLVFTIVIFIYTDYKSTLFNSSIEVSLENNNYLMMSDAYAMLSFFIIAHHRKLLFRISLIVVAFMCLYFLKSRASLYMFLFMNIMGLILINKRFLWLLFFGGIISLFSYDWNEFFRLNSNNRMIRLATFGQDTSAKVRTSILSSGLKEIKDNWLWGQFMGDVLIEKNTGTYIHNFFSYLRQFGFFPFLILIVVLVRNYLKLMYSVYKKQWNKPMEFIFLFGIHCLVLSLFARSFLYSGIWMFCSAIPTLYHSKSWKQ